MKLCPKCNREYADETLNFCLEDGEWLESGPTLHGPTTSVLPKDSLKSEAPTLISGGRNDTHQLSTTGTLVSEIKRHKVGVAVTLLFFVCAAAAVVYSVYFFASRKVPGRNALKIVRLTNIGKVGPSSISADGKYVVYVAAEEDGQSSIWVKHVPTGGTAQVVPPAGAEITFNAPVFTPDGNYIYYVRTETGRPSILQQVPVLGGTSKKVLERVPNAVAFAPDGKKFAFMRRYPDAGEDALVVANSDGSGEQKVVVRKLPDFLISGSASWSPDGTMIACGIGSFTDGYYRTIAAVQVVDGQVKALTSHKWGGPGFERVIWLHDMTGLLVTAQDQTSAPWQIWHVSYPDGEVRPVTSDLSNYRMISLTADSETIAASLVDTAVNISVIPNGSWNDVRQITSGKDNGGGEGRVAWTPDGHIVYSSRAGGNPDIWIMDADGRNRRQITDDDQYERSFSVTPDGRHIVFDSHRSGPPQIWIVDLDGSNLRQVTNGLGAFNSCLTPDGKWVVYTSFGPNGFNIEKVSIDGGEPVQIIPGSSRLPSISPDGKYIAYYRGFGGLRVDQLTISAVDGGEPMKSFETASTHNRALAPRWTPDGRSIAYIDTRNLVSNIWLQPVGGGPPKQLTDFKTESIFTFDWSPDGKWLALSRGAVNADVVLITNFR